VLCLCFVIEVELDFRVRTLTHSGVWELNDQLRVLFVGLSLHRPPTEAVTNCDSMDDLGGQTTKQTTASGDTPAPGSTAATLILRSCSW